MLKGGRAFLLLKNLRPVDRAQHKTVIQVCEVMLGKSFKSLTEQFESMRRKRNELTYEFGALLSKTEIKAALEDAEAWIHGIAQKVKEQNPQLDFPFSSGESQT